MKWYWQDRGKRRLKETCPTATSFTTNPTCSARAAKAGLRSDKPANNHLTYGKIKPRVTGNVNIPVIINNNWRLYKVTGKFVFGVLIARYYI